MNKQEIERAIKYWKEFKEEIPELKESYPDAGLDEQEECVDMAIFALTHQLTNGWIPVSEKLPKEYKCVDGNDCYMMSEDVLCSAYNEETGEYDMWIDYTIDGEWRTHEYYEGEKLAWQPLPPEYKEVSE